MTYGDLGHLSIIIAFVASLLASIGYFCAGQSSVLALQNQWVRFGRCALTTQSIFVFFAIGLLFYLLFSHHYEYLYVWKHSSNDLPWYFLISCFWEGQEGSFLLWIFWNTVIGAILVFTSNKKQEAPTMAFFSIIQFFLLSMVLGLYVSPELKIGSSAFALLKDSLADPIFQIDPRFVPNDGKGLNPLLQNGWMVIHPPVIFLSFSLCGVPFSQVMGNLWKPGKNPLPKQLAPWLLVSVGALGIGIMMGAYWAYETLNFGGYWNWDPVENAVLVPWLILLAAIHGAIWYRRKQKGLALTTLLILLGYLLVLYSTFLTRSGILGNTSVHSFTDLGLSAQLTIFLLFFCLLAAFLLFKRRKQLTATDEVLQTMSLDFWMTLGISALCLSALQVVITMSIPVFNAISESFGAVKKLAPPADQVAFYSKFQIWFAISFCLLGAIAQLFYWKKIQSFKQLESATFMPLLLATVGTAILVLAGKVSDVVYILTLFFASYLSLVSLAILIAIIKNQHSKALGGLLSHIGAGVLLIGLVFSAGHQEVVSQNMTINAPDSDLPPHTIQKNLLLGRNLPKENKGYQLTYQNRYTQLTSGDLVPSDGLAGITGSLRMVLQPTVSLSGKTFDEGDTLRIDKENTYYGIKLTKGAKTYFMLPRVQNNPTMGVIASPDIQHFLTHDIYTHVTNYPNPEKITWKDTVSFVLSPGQLFEYQGLEFSFSNVQRVNEVPGVATSTRDLNIEATLSITSPYEKYEARPLFQIKESSHIRLYPSQIPALGFNVLLAGIEPEKDLYTFTVVSSQRDWITIQSVRFPLINLVWLGFMILSCGIGFAIYSSATRDHSYLEGVIVGRKTIKTPHPHEIEVKHPLARELK
ncbi:MAG: cytochrome c biogenesis protein CcsA [Bacteroidota bacterium]